jgi:hypothetical protein
MPSQNGHGWSARWNDHEGKRRRMTFRFKRDTEVYERKMKGEWSWPFAHDTKSGRCRARGCAAAGRSRSSCLTAEGAAILRALCPSARQSTNPTLS